MDGPSRAEVERLYQTMDAGFKGTHDRLDVLNGRTLRGEVAHAEIRTRVINLEHEIFRSRRDDASPHGISKRDGALAAFALAVIVALLRVLEVVGMRAFELLHLGK